MVRNSLLRARTDVDRARRLCNLIARLAREAWIALGIRLIACIGTRLAGTGAQLASILLLTVYLDHVLDDTGLPLPFVGEVPARADRVIYAAGTIIVGLFVLSGVLNYLYGRWSWRLASDFELHLIRRAAYMLSAAPLWRKEIDGVPLTASTMRKVIGSDPRRAQFAFRHLLEGAVEPVTIAAWIGAMAWLNPGLTALIVPVLLVALPFVMRVNQRASSMTRDLEATQALSAPERQLLYHRLRNRLIDPVGADPWVEQFVGSGQTAANVHTFGARQIVMEESKIVSTLAFGVLLLLVVWVGGGAALDEEMSWGALVAFLLLTRALLSQAVSLGGTITHSSRLYPILSRYFALVDGGAAAQRDVVEGTPAAPGAVTVSARSLDGEAAAIELRAGDRVGIMTFQPADTQLIVSLCAAFERADDASLSSLFGRVAFVTGGAVPGVSRPAGAGLPTFDGPVADDVVRLLSQSGLSEAANAVQRLDGDRPFERDEAADLPGFFAPAVLLALAAISNASTVVVDTSAILRIPQAPRRHLLGRLGDRLVLLVYPIGLPPGRLFAFDERALLVHLADGPDHVYLINASQWPGSKRRLQSLLRGREAQTGSVPDEVDAELEEHDV